MQPTTCISAFQGRGGKVAVGGQWEEESRSRDTGGCQRLGRVGQVAQNQLVGDKARQLITDGAGGRYGPVGSWERMRQAQTTASEWLLARAVDQGEPGID